MTLSGSSEYFKKANNNSKKTWDSVGSLISTLPKYIKCDDEGNSSSDPNFIINKLNKDFVSKGPKLVGESGWIAKTKTMQSEILEKKIKK